MPPAPAYANHLQNSQSSPRLDSWNHFGGKVAESWYCDLCNIDLPNEATWQMVNK